MDVFFTERPLKSFREPDISISFTETEVGGLSYPYDDALVVTMLISNFTTRRVLVDNRSSADVPYYLALKKMGITQGEIKPFKGPLAGFFDEQVQPLGSMSFLVKIRTHPCQATCMVEFLVVNCPSAYNAIFG